MRRTGLRRRAGLRSYVRLRRHTPMKRRNARRLARLRGEQYGPQAELCRRTPCWACGKPPPSEAHHEPPRKAGGVNADDSDTLPLCYGRGSCHELRHGINGGRRAVEEKFGVDLDAGKREMRRRLLDGRTWDEVPE